MDRVAGRAKKMGRRRDGKGGWRSETRRPIGAGNPDTAGRVRFPNETGRRGIQATGWARTPRGTCSRMGPAVGSTRAPRETYSRMRLSDFKGTLTPTPGKATKERATKEHVPPPGSSGTRIASEGREEFHPEIPELVTVSAPFPS